MIVCHCKSVSDKDIKKLLNNGCKTFKDVQKKCCAGTDCKICCSLIKEIIKGNDDK